MTQAANQFLKSAGIPGATIEVTPDPPSSAPLGGSVSVKVSVSFTEVSWLPSPLFLGASTMTAKATMRRETVQ